MKQAFLTFAAALLSCTPVRADDWPMLGGRPDRNMVSAEKGLPLTWDPWKRKNIKWVAELGAGTNYGAPVVSGGKLFIGTNNEKPRDPAVKGDKGVLMCFSEADGKFLWQAVHDKLTTGDAEDTKLIGVCSTPCVVGNRVYYVSNRAELVCRAVEDGKQVWILDMRKELGVSPNQASSSCPLVVGDLVFVNTGQGADHKTKKVMNPKAPSFIAVDRSKGTVKWQDPSPGDRILWGQWGSPAYGVVDGQPQVAFPGGDGWLYSFEPATGKLLWKFNCKAHEKPAANVEHETENQLVALPVFTGHRVIIAVGDPEASVVEGALRAIDAQKRGDVTKDAELWKLAGMDFYATISTVAVHENLVYAISRNGIFTCVDLATGKPVWTHDLLAEIWGSPLVADGKVFVQNGDGEVVVFQAGREKKVLATNNVLPKNMKSEFAHGTVVAANGVLYIVGERNLYAVAQEK